MLTADQLDALIDPIIGLYDRYMQTVINDIARRLAGLNYASPTAAWQMQRLTESGKIYEDALQELARFTGQSETALRGMFARAGVKAIRFDDAIYKAAGLNPMPLNLSPAMAQVLAAGLEKTGGLMRNLTLSSAAQGQSAFLDAADLAYMQISSGAFDYNSAIRQAVKSVADKGLGVVNYVSGRVDQLDVAIRRTALTGVNQTVGRMQWARADEMGQDLVQTSAHAGARPDHQVWQGRVFSRSGASTEYPNFVAETGYGTGPGLMGWNCRHSFFPFFEGISENAYSEADRANLANQRVTYQGKGISLYEATQEQRGIERKIRYWKRQEGALKAAGLDATEETTKVRAWQAQMRDFTKQTGLQRQSERERIGYTSDLTKPTAKINFRSKEYQRVTNLGDVRGYYRPNDPGINYAVSRPVVYNEFASRHLLSDATYRSRIPWLEQNQDGFVRAISSPDLIEKQLRLRKDGFFSATHIVELVGEAGDVRFLAVAISLSKNPSGGYHQITTIHPMRWKDIFKSDGTLREKYVRTK